MSKNKTNRINSSSSSSSRSSSSINSGKGLNYYWNLTTHSKEKPSQTKMSKVEESLRRYLEEFDGRKKDFHVIEPLYSELFHHYFRGVTVWGNRVDNKQVRDLHASLLKHGVKARLTRFRRAGCNAYEVVIELSANEALFANGDVFMLIHKRINVSNDKIVSAIDTSLASEEADFNNFFLDEMRLRRHWGHDLSLAVQPDVSNPSYDLQLAC